MLSTIQLNRELYKRSNLWQSCCIGWHSNAQVHLIEWQLNVLFQSRRREKEHYVPQHILKYTQSVYSSTWTSLQFLQTEPPLHLCWESLCLSDIAPVFSVCREARDPPPKRNCSYQPTEPMVSELPQTEFSNTVHAGGCSAVSCWLHHPLAVSVTGTLQGV